ncbi:YdeI/OmpD-associated family protein [Mucilaginibacter auburnensis]|uniref:Bacteriocin resistance YdeI/OmpD-like protein n=1 Tax=Mucilaginibacter auburnensis TaxID=1457233 RepID=A0A2H9VNG4_9SPHI|nr:YdeI/OmpD-associated family protein [Mucilaginibacter auburnensis]PJJ79853.1 bacteriocin resistance YdeI/OmpD-like protein [Mucilaginibacter auburnensis]
MTDFTTIILQFDEQGEKTGWTYIEIPADIAQKLKPGNKKSFRVKGWLDGFAVAGMAAMPMGEGNFILALNAEVRKGTRKGAGGMLAVKLEEDKDYKVEVPADLQECFEFDPDAGVQFNSLARSHRDYFIKWINSAKTSETRERRIVNTVNAMLRKWDYGTMIREMRKEV